MRIWKPILFSAPMVKAILDGRKTMTRRVIVPQPPAAVVTMREGCKYERYDWVGEDLHGEMIVRDKGILYSAGWRCPWPVGTRLWVRETWKPWWDTSLYCVVRFRADDALIKPELPNEATGYRFAAECEAAELGDAWHPSIFMPKWAARIGLGVTAVGWQRVQSISEADAIAEGFAMPEETECIPLLGEPLVSGNVVRPGLAGCLCSTGGYGAPRARDSFAGYWDSLNAKRGYGWEVNPHVFAHRFTVLSTDYAETQQMMREDAA